MDPFTTTEIELLRFAVSERKDVLEEFRRQSEMGGSYGPDVFTDDINAYKTIERKLRKA